VAKVLERNEVTVPVFDLQKLRSTFGEDDCLEVIRTFVSAHGSSPLRIQAAREAAALSDLRALAHKLKGAASMACLKELSQTSGMLEQASARSDWDEIDKLLAQLMRQFERADLALNSVLAGKA
jgi:HPt (histidine-containing phosphotransfer) domain-containing protein